MTDVGCWSIELEPRTLRGGQLNHAREEAADVARKLKPTDATVIFIEGLRPVGSVKKIIIDEEVEEDHQEHEYDDDKVVELFEKKNQNNVEICCQCPCKSINASSDSVEEEDHNIDNKLIIREPLSAPF